MGINIETWRMRIGHFFPLHRSRKTISLFSIYLNNSVFNSCIHLAFLISILLIVSGIEPNPGPDTRTRSNTDSTHDTSIVESLSKIINEITVLRQEQAVINQNITLLCNSVATRLDAIETNVQSHDAQLAALRTTCNDLNLKLFNITAQSISPPANITTGSLSAQSAPVNVPIFSASVDYNKIIISEMRTRESKRYNIIISGVRSTGGTDDNTLVRSILDEINISATAASCRRIPTKSTSTRPQLLLVSF